MSNLFGVPSRLDASKFSLAPDALTIFSRMTGIRDEEQLKAHLIEQTRKAYEEVYKYPCLLNFGHLDFRMTTHPLYGAVVKQGIDTSRPGRFLLDIGTAVGTDARRVVLDGWPSERVYAVDINKKLIDIGRSMFCDSPFSNGIIFVVGDIFADKFVDPSLQPSWQKFHSNSFSSLRPPSTLHCFAGRFTAIYAGSWFHLFDRETQSDLAKRLLSLAALPTVKGKPTFIFGRHVGREPAGDDPVEDIDKWRDVRSGKAIFRHSADTWKLMWSELSAAIKDAGIKVMVNVESRGFETAVEQARGYKEDRMLYWSVELTRDVITVYNIELVNKIDRFSV